MVRSWRPQQLQRKERRPRSSDRNTTAPACRSAHEPKTMIGRSNEGKPSSQFPLSVKMDGFPKKKNQDALPPVHPSCHSRPSSTLCFIGGNYPGLLPADQSHANALMLRWSGGTGFLEKDRFVDGDREAPETHARKGQTCWLLTPVSCWGVHPPRFTTQSWNLSGREGSNLTPITSSG